MFITLTKYIFNFLLLSKTQVIIKHYCYAIWKYEFAVRVILYTGYFEGSAALCFCTRIAVSIVCKYIYYLNFL
jgi:hypothetical protein